MLVIPARITGVPEGVFGKVTPPSFTVTPVSSSSVVIDIALPLTPVPVVTG